MRLQYKKLRLKYKVIWLNKWIHNCETKIWLISVLMITKQDLELMIIFQVCLGNLISKVTITKTNQCKEKSLRKKKP